jgi:hypothetical protein
LNILLLEEGEEEVGARSIQEVAVEVEVEEYSKVHLLSH